MISCQSEDAPKYRTVDKGKVGYKSNDSPFQGLK